MTFRVEELSKKFDVPRDLIFFFHKEGRAVIGRERLHVEIFELADMQQSDCYTFCYYWGNVLFYRHFFIISPLWNEIRLHFVTT